MNDVGPVVESRLYKKLGGDPNLNRGASPERSGRQICYPESPDGPKYLETYFKRLWRIPTFWVRFGV